MSAEEKPKSWWHTVPGVIASLTAAITALAGLVVAINQTGWLAPRTPPTVTQPPGPAQPSAPAPGPSVAPAAPTPVVTPPASGSASRYAVGLPAMRDYRLGPASFKATFTLLQAEVTPETAEKDLVRIRIRMMNHDRYDKNFWDRSFRLIVNGVPTAPENRLNELVAGEAAREGEVTFLIPRGTTDGTLRITYYDDSTEIPLRLGSPRESPRRQDSSSRPARLGGPWGPISG